MTLKTILTWLTIIGLAVTLSAIGFYAYKKKQVPSLPTKTTSTFTGRKFALRNIHISPASAKELGIVCMDTPSEKRSEDVIIGCSNLSLAPATSSVPCVLVGTTRYDTAHPKTPETLARQSLMILGYASSTVTVDCVTSTPIPDGNVIIVDTLCTNAKNSTLIRTYSLASQPVPTLWIGMTSGVSSVETLKETMNAFIVKNKPVSAVTSGLFSPFIDTAYAQVGDPGGDGVGGASGATGGDGSGSGGTGGTGGTGTGDPAADPASSPCGVCACEGTCSTGNTYVPPGSDPFCTTSGYCDCSVGGYTGAYPNCVAPVAPAACSPNTGQTCNSVANFCGVTGSGKIKCDGTCDAITPDGPSGWLADCSAIANNPGNYCSTDSCNDGCNTYIGTKDCTPSCNAGYYWDAATSSCLPLCTAPQTWNGSYCVNPAPEPVWTSYCTGANDVNGNNWQIWEYDNSNPPNYRYTGESCAPVAESSCSATSKTWLSNCSGSTATTANGGSSVVTNTAGGYSGSATYTCNNGTWSAPSGATCTVVAASSCSATSKTWLSNCSGSTATTASGQSSTVTNTARGYTGSATFPCLNGVWYSPSNTTCNVSTTPLGPDLTADTVSVPATVAARTNVVLSSIIRNQGGANTGNSFNNFMQVATAADGGGTITDLLPILMSMLAAGDSLTTTTNYMFESYGTYSVRACADKANRYDVGTIAESDEDHNCSVWKTVTAGAGPTITNQAVNYPNITFVCNDATSWSVSRNEGGFIKSGRTTSGATVTVPITLEGNYTLSCTEGSLYASVVVNYKAVGNTSTSMFITASPRTVYNNDSVTLFWSIPSPTAACSLRAEVVCLGGHASCSAAQLAEEAAINTQLTSGTTDASDPYGASRNIQTAVKTVAPQNNPGNAKALGKKTLVMKKSVDFLLRCGGAASLNKKVRVVVSDENEG